MRTRGWALVIMSTLTAAAGGAAADGAVEVAASIDVTVTVEATAAPPPSFVVDAAPLPVVVDAAPLPFVVDTSASAGAASALTSSTPLVRPHWEAALAMVLPLELGDPGLHAAVGRQIGSFRLAGEYTLTDAASDRAMPGALAVVSDCGQRQRLGVAARYRLGLGTPDVGVGFYLEGGLGQATTRWSKTGTSRRDDALIGLGFELAGGGARLAGFELGGRFTIADGDGPDAAREVTGVITVGLLVGG
ncbi:MAG: hypothetical protein IPL61_36855 [Myxococcales bacterium]|nr:hypothetical protein [Myxococcales bacterium]